MSDANVYATLYGKTWAAAADAERRLGDIRLIQLNAAQGDWGFVTGSLIVTNRPLQGIKHVLFASGRRIADAHPTLSQPLEQAVTVFRRVRYHTHPTKEL